MQCFGGRYAHITSWRDHHGPFLITLLNICQQIYDHLAADVENVVVIHCNAGKGRTGTLICSYLMFCGFADSAENAIIYYGMKRFKTGLGVTQPCQLRYIYYLEKLL